MISLPSFLQPTWAYYIDVLKHFVDQTSSLCFEAAWIHSSRQIGIIESKPVVNGMKKPQFYRRASFIRRLPLQKPLGSGFCRRIVYRPASNFEGIIIRNFCCCWWKAVQFHKHIECCYQSSSMQLYITICSKIQR